MAAEIFISYAREDETRVQHLARTLETRGWSVFWDRRIPAGKTWRSYIGKALGGARCIIVAWSRHSIESHWVMEEADEGQKRGILVPVLLDAVEPPIGFRSINAGDLTDWEPDRASPRFEQLVQDIKAVLGSPGAAPKAALSAGPAASAGEVPRGLASGERRVKRFAYPLVAGVLAVVTVVGYWAYQKGHAERATPSSELAQARTPADQASVPSTESDSAARKPPKPAGAPADQSGVPTTRAVLSVPKPFLWVLDRSHKLSVADVTGGQVKEIAPVQLDRSIGGNRVLSASPDGGFAVAVSAYEVTDKLARYNLDGSRAWSIKTGSYCCVSVARTGYTYAIKNGSNNSGRDIVQKINSETGNIEKQIELRQRYFDIVVDERNENVWVAGQAITRLDLDLEERWTKDPIEWYVVSIDHAPDGTLLAAERKYTPTNMGQNRLLNVDANGEILNSTPLDFSPARVVANRGFWDVWVVGEGVIRFNPKDPSWDKPKRYEIGPASYVDVSHDGSAWIATHKGILRISRDGQPIGELAEFATEQACLAVVSGDN